MSAIIESISTSQSQEKNSETELQTEATIEDLIAAICNHPEKFGRKSKTKPEVEAIGPEEIIFYRTKRFEREGAIGCFMGLKGIGYECMLYDNGRFEVTKRFF